MKWHPLERIVSARGGEEMYGEYEQVNGAVANALQAEVEALRADAKRYRWLRENAGAWEVSRDCGEWKNCETGEKFKPRVYFTAFSTGYGGMRLDDAIDAAMDGSNA